MVYATYADGNRWYVAKMVRKIPGSWKVNWRKQESQQKAIGITTELKICKGKPRQDAQIMFFIFHKGTV